MIQKAMILTAGLGTRLRPITDTYAKPAVSFLNVPLLHHALALVREAGATDLVLNTHHKPEQIESLARSLAGKFHTLISHEPGAPLGSGGGIWKARGKLEGSGDFLVANGDEVILPLSTGVMKRFSDTHVSHNSLATLLVMEHPLVGSQFGGVWSSSHHRVLGFGKDRALFPNAHAGYHYIGLLILNDRIFSYLPEGESNILYDALQNAIHKGETVLAHVERFTWFETGNPQDFLLATSAALDLLAADDRQREDTKTLKAIHRSFSPHHSSLISNGEYKALISKQAEVHPDTEFDGFVVVGSKTKIDRGVRLSNCVILPDTHIRSGAKIHNEIRF